MKKIIVLVLTFVFSTLTINADDAKKYGNEISLKDITLISKIMENPESFVGKKVLVEGNVVAVCEKRGCWINLSSDKEFETMRIKVNDGEIVFPMEAKGKKALVEGEVYSIVVEGEGCGGDCADEKKEDKNHKCEHEKTTKKVYQIKGLGAVIK